MALLSANSDIEIPVAMAGREDRNKTWMIPSPVGALAITSDGEALVGLSFDATPCVDPAPRADGDDILEQVSEELDSYFANRLTEFRTPLRFVGGTEFQRSVWQGLQTIPFGRTWSYSELAEAIGRPKAVRAVGAANGANPIAIIVPCHRVIGASGALVGFAGGLACKRRLLEVEGIVLPWSNDSKRR